MNELIAKLNASGLVVSNMFQLDDGTWRVNFRSVERGREYAEHENLEEAIKLAASRAVRQVQTEAVVLKHSLSLEELDL